MKLPVTIIEGAKLMERWGMGPVDLFMMMANHQLPDVGKMVGNKGWFELEWDDVLRWVLKEKQDISDFVFRLADVMRIEKEYRELTSKSNKLLRGKELMKKWDNTDMEIIDMIDNGSLNPVDPVGVPMDDLYVEFMLADRFATTADLLFRISDVEGLEQQYPDLKSFKQTQEKSELGSAPTVSFYKNGQFWRIGEKGKEKGFRHKEGFGFIRFLISYPNYTFKASEVYYFGNVPDEFKGEDYQKLSDHKSYEKILTWKMDLEKQLRKTIYPDKAKEIEEKIDACERTLENANKAFGSNRDKIRSNLRKRIKTAIETIAREAEDYPSLKPLTKYLSLENPDKRIKTGNNLWYRPDPSNPVNWVLDPPNP